MLFSFSLRTIFFIFIGTLIQFSQGLVHLMNMILPYHMWDHMVFNCIKNNSFGLNIFLIVCGQKGSICRNYY